MKTGIFIIPLIFVTCINLLAQKVLIQDDATIQITIDSIGYQESHPLDIPDETGLFIYSANGLEALRIYGSLRLLAIWENKKNFHAYDLTQPTIPTGIDDYYYPHSIASINMSRLGFDAMIGSKKFSDMLIRIELDWKGDS